MGVTSPTARDKAVSSLDIPLEWDVFLRTPTGETIAIGDPGCRVVVHLKSETLEGREYYKSVSPQ